MPIDHLYTGFVGIQYISAGQVEVKRENAVVIDFWYSLHFGENYIFCWLSQNADLYCA